MRPHILMRKLYDIVVNTNIIRWGESFLTDHVRVNKAVSLPTISNTGVTQGSMISPVLFTPYTSDCRGTTMTPIFLNLPMIQLLLDG